ncbi:hypothetical protein ABIE61_001413 [Marinobacterium sp. MBR-111]|jgi:hypothetical protein
MPPACFSGCADMRGLLIMGILTPLVSPPTFRPELRGITTDHEDLNDETRHRGHQAVQTG